MEKKAQVSLWDMLVRIMPDLPEGFTFRVREHTPVNSKAAATLFSLWKDEKNKVDNDTLKRPASISLEEISAMQRAGLVKNHGEKIEITSKGKEIIRTMILGDEKSSFEDDGSVLPFETAFANTKVRAKTAKSKVSARLEPEGTNWYLKLKK